LQGFHLADIFLMNLDQPVKMIVAVLVSVVVAVVVAVVG
jgi:hypothetical protein